MKLTKLSLSVLFECNEIQRHDVFYTAVSKHSYMKENRFLYAPVLLVRSVEYTHSCYSESKWG